MFAPSRRAPSFLLGRCVPLPQAHSPGPVLSDLGVGPAPGPEPGPPQSRWERWLGGGVLLTGDCETEGTCE